MKPACFLIAIGLCLPGPGSAAMAQASAIAEAEAPRIGRCRQGNCAWFRIEARATVRIVAGERLVQIRVAEGESEHPGDRYPASAEGVAIDWTAASEIHFLCSTTRPTALLPGDGGWDAVRLDFVNGPAGALEFTSAEYVAACHPGEDMNRPGFAARQGYREQSDDSGSVNLTRPEEIFEPGH